MKYLIALTIVLFSFSIKGQDLRLNLQVGETYTQIYSNKSEVNQTIMGMEQNITISISSGLNFTVKQDLGDGYLMDVSYRDISMTMALPQGETSFSTEEGSEEPMSKMMRSMINKEFQVEMLKNGKVSSVKNLEGIFDNLFEAMPELPEQQKKQLQDQMMQSYGEESFKGNIEMVSAILPGRKVKVGDSWSNDTNLQSGFSVMINNTFTLKEVNSSNVIIEGTSQMSTDEEASAVEVNGMSTIYTLKGEMKTRYVLDPKTNWVMEGKVEQSMSGEAQIEDSPQIPGGITIPMTINNLMLVGQ